nr:ribonuclease H-like domain-containing protein [Tanacetum cinerariifolium]
MKLSQGMQLIQKLRNDQKRKKKVLKSCQEVMSRNPIKTGFYRENFYVILSKGLHKGYDRFQSLLTQLETHEGLHKGYDRFQSLLTQLETHGTGVSTEDADQKFLSSPQLDHKDLEQVGRKLHFDAKEPVGFDKSKAECFNCHNTRHFARECRSKGNQDSRRRDLGNTRYKARDNGMRHAKQDEHKAMVTIDGEGVDWPGHAKDDTEDYALMAFNSNNSGSDTKPPKPDFRIDESNFTYGPKQSTTSESDAKTGDLDSCDSSSSEETLKTVPKLLESKPRVFNKHKVWSDAPIIEEYESDSDDEYVSKALVEQEKPSCAFINSVKHVKTPRQTNKEQNTCNQNPKPSKRDWNGLKSKRMSLGYGYIKKACFVCVSFSHLIRDCDFYEKRMAKQVELNKQKSTTSTSSARKVNTARPKVNKIRPRHNVYKSHSPIRKPFNRTTSPKANFAQHKVNTVGDKSLSAVGGKWETAVKASACCNWRYKRQYWNRVSKYNSGSKSKECVDIQDNPHQTLKGKGIVDSGCSRHMTGNKAYLVDYQDFNGSHVAFGGSKGQITGKFKEKSDERFLVGYSLSSKDFRPITVENKANKTACPKETNNSAGTQYSFDVGNSEMEAD